MPAEPDPETTDQVEHPASPLPSADDNTIQEPGTPQTGDPQPADADSGTPPSQPADTGPENERALLTPSADRAYGSIRWIFDGQNPASADFHAVDLKDQKKPIAGFHITGRCPACTHTSYSLFPLLAVVTGPGNVLVPVPSSGGGQDITVPQPILGPAPEAAELIYGSIHCNCAAYHDGANGSFGCGANWLLSVNLDLKAGSQPEHPDLRPVTEQDLGRYWPAAEAVATAVPGALARFQAKAASWQTGVAGLVTAAGLAALTAERTTIQGLESPWDSLIIAAIIIATLASTANIAIALWANVGFPSVRTAVGARTLAGADLAPIRRAAKASSWLKRGTWAAGLAFVAGFFALASLIATPDKGAEDTKVSLSLYHVTSRVIPTPSPQTSPAPTASPGTTVKATEIASPVCAIIEQGQPTPSANAKSTPIIVVVEPDSTPTPSETVSIPVPSIAAVSPGCP